MSDVTVSNDGDIIESRNYLSNYFVTLNGDQQINGNKTFNNVNVSTINVSQVISSSLDISTNTITLNKKPINALEIIFGLSNISPNLTEGTIFFKKTFDLEPCVTISQYSTSRIVPICITEINVNNFKWAAGSSNVGKIIWSAGINSDSELFENELFVNEPALE